jgi:hypothetical protein
MHHPHPVSTFGTSSVPILPTGHEDLEGWVYQRARTCEATLSPEEVFDADEGGVDVRAINAIYLPTGAPRLEDVGFARFNGRWFVPLSRTAVASGLDPAGNPGEFIALDDAECMALDRVREHWRTQAEGGQ